MAQNPFKVDQLQVEPGVAGTRLIRRKTSDNSLEFSDGVAGALSLKMLASLNLDYLLVVGTGSGSQYATIQEALDAVPASHGDTPYTILVGPGFYPENVVIEKDTVSILGLGNPFIYAAAGSAVTVQQGVSSTPLTLNISSMTIFADSASAALRVIGGASSHVVEEGLVVRDCNVGSTSGKSLYATSACSLFFRGTTFGGDITTADCGRVIFQDCFIEDGVGLTYDTAGTLPFVTGGSCYLKGCILNSSSDPTLTVGLQGAGDLTMFDCLTSGGVRVYGDQRVVLTGSYIGNLTLDDTASAVLQGTMYGTPTVAATASMSEPLQSGVIVFVADTTKTVAFARKQTDASYQVSLELQVDAVAMISSKSVSGFGITFTAPQTTTVGWTVTRGTTNY